MEKMEALYWVAELKLAKSGDEEAQAALRAENAMRSEQQRPTVEEELREMAAQEERLSKITYPKRKR